MSLAEIFDTIGGFFSSGSNTSGAMPDANDFTWTHLPEGFSSEPGFGIYSPSYYANPYSFLAGQPEAPPRTPQYASPQFQPPPDDLAFGSTELPPAIEMTPPMPQFQPIEQAPAFQSSGPGASRPDTSLFSGFQPQTSGPPQFGPVAAPRIPSSPQPAALDPGRGNIPASLPQTGGASLDPGGRPLPPPIPGQQGQALDPGPSTFPQTGGIAASEQAATRTPPGLSPQAVPEFFSNLQQRLNPYPDAYMNSGIQSGLPITVTPQGQVVLRLPGQQPRLLGQQFRR